MSSFSSPGSLDNCQRRFWLAPAEALFGSQLIVPGEFLDAPDQPSTDFLQKIDKRSPNSPDTCFAPAKPLPKTLLSSEFVFVCKYYSVPPVSQLYHGPYKVVNRKDKYFKLQIGSKQDKVSDDRMKPVFSNKKVSPALPPPHGRPSRRHPPPAANPPPPAVNPSPPMRITNKSVCFSLPPFYRCPFWGGVV